MPAHPSCLLRSQYKLYSRSIITCSMSLLYSIMSWGYRKGSRANFNQEFVNIKYIKCYLPWKICLWHNTGRNREFCTSLSFLDYFLLVLPGLLCPCQVTGLPTTDSTAIFSFFGLSQQLRTCLFLFLPRVFWVLFPQLSEALCYSSVSNYSRSVLICSYS